MCVVSTIPFSVELYLNRNSHLGNSIECWPGWYFHRYLCFKYDQRSPGCMDCRHFCHSLCLLGDFVWLILVLGLWPRSVLACMGVGRNIAHPFTFPLNPPCSSLTHSLCPHNKGSQLCNLHTPWKVLQSSLSSEKPNGASLWKQWHGELLLNYCLMMRVLPGTFQGSYLCWISFISKMRLIISSI